MAHRIAHWIFLVATVLFATAAFAQSDSQPPPVEGPPPGQEMQGQRCKEGEMQPPVEFRPTAARWRRTPRRLRSGNCSPLRWGTAWRRPDHSMSYVPARCAVANVPRHVGLKKRWRNGATRLCHPVMVHRPVMVRRHVAPLRHRVMGRRRSRAMDRHRNRATDRRQAIGRHHHRPLLLRHHQRLLIRRRLITELRSRHRAVRMRSCFAPAFRARTRVSSNAYPRIAQNCHKPARCTCRLRAPSGRPRHHRERRICPRPLREAPRPAMNRAASRR